MKIIQPLAETDAGDLVPFGQRFDVTIEPLNQSIRIILGSERKYSTPDILIELQATGWVLYIHNGQDGEPTRIDLPVEGDE